MGIIPADQQLVLGFCAAVWALAVGFWFALEGRRQKKVKPGEQEDDDV